MRNFITILAISYISLISVANPSTVRQDRIWEYVGMEPFSGSYYFHYFRFSDPIVINGTVYYTFEKFVTLDANGDTVDNRILNQYCDLVRECDGKIYAFIQDYHISPTAEMANYDNDYKNFSEKCIYDYTLSDGDKWIFRGFPFSTNDYETVVNIFYDCPLWIENEECLNMGFKDCLFMGNDCLRFIQGIGPTCNGTISRPNIDNISGPVDNSTYPGIQSKLNRVFNENGEVIYRDIDCMEPSDNITYQINNINNSNIIFDLHGHKVDSPQRGSIYIRNGKKIVWE